MPLVGGRAARDLLDGLPVERERRVRLVQFGHATAALEPSHSVLADYHS
ncbi:hypothetical protein AB0N93_37910 [Streptomyces sp. NPDC091267]